MPTTDEINANMGWSLRPNSSFDPFTQNFTITSPDGVTPMTANLADVLAMSYLGTTQGIIYGAETGVTGLLLVTMLLMTTKEKRRSRVFALNSLSLLLAFLRSLLSCFMVTGIFYNFYNWQMDWYPMVSETRRAIAISLTAEIFSVLFDMFVYSSLALQVYVVCCTLQNPWRSLVIGASCLVATAATIIRLVLAVLNGKYSILGVQTVTVAESLQISYVASVQNIFSTASIAFFASIFNIKLFFAILARRRMNVKQFGPMQIIFIMGCQTLLVPCQLDFTRFLYNSFADCWTVIFSIVVYFGLQGTQISSFAPTMVAIFLPLSGMWATANTNSRQAAATQDRNGRLGVLPSNGLSPARLHHHVGEKDPFGTDANVTTITSNDEDVELGTNVVIKDSSVTSQPAVHFHQSQPH